MKGKKFSRADASVHDRSLATITWLKMFVKSESIGAAFESYQAKRLSDI